VVANGATGAAVRGVDSEGSSENPTATSDIAQQDRSRERYLKREAALAMELDWTSFGTDGSYAN
jgi:hypothetical protein